MKTLFCLVFALAAAMAYPADDPSKDVELIPPKKTNTKNPEETVDDEDDYGGSIPVLVIRQRPSFGRNPFFGGSFFDRNFGGFPFGGSGAFPFDDDESVDSDSDDKDSVDKEDDSTTGCGFICRILNDLQAHIDQLDKEFHSILTDKKNKTAGAGDKDFDVFNETYTEKTLPDGSVVKINRTVIADTSDDGNSFFFHSTSFHNQGDLDAEDEDEEVDHEFKDSATSSTSTTTSSRPTTTPDEESFNEVLDGAKKTGGAKTKGIDDGLTGAQ